MSARKAKPREDDAPCDRPGCTKLVGEHDPLDWAAHIRDQLGVALVEIEALAADLAPEPITSPPARPRSAATHQLALDLFGDPR